MTQRLAGRETASGDATAPSPPSTGEPAPPSLRRLSFALPVRNGLPPLERYAQLERDGRRHLAGYVETSRGCKHLCLHCPIPPVYNGRFFVVPAERVLQDVRRLVKAGAEHITFGDPDFFNGPGHAMRVARAVHAEFPELTFDATVKVEHLLKHQALLPELRTLGCLFLVSAVESLSDEVLRNLRKGHTRADVRAASALVRAAGISLRPSLVSFTPWTALEDYLDVLDWVERDGLVECVDPVQYAIRLLVPPGSALLGSKAMSPFLGPLDAASLSYRWSHPDPRMDRLHGEVSRLVESATREGEEPGVTFQRIRGLAGSYLPDRNRERPLPPAERARTDGSGRRPPRLTEAWFC